MKKEKIDDNQLTFFDVIDGGKHEEDKKNIMKFKKKQLIDVQYAPYEEMFSGFLALIKFRRLRFHMI